ncbi:MAG: helicase C-terminal domain-containing protein [Candidatus Cloacimonadaceae bacterium]|nr:DEAD/DEAH box helicase family protein [Candidatus Cloacimonadota bacterium]MDX9950344.1 helicase C-terminal domain-containing protein [Candidatus Syntrophosphaera sp.]
MEKHDPPSLREKLNFTAIDAETTGLNPKKDEIIELAAVRFRAGEPVERFSTLVRPKRDIPKFIQFLTHINPEDLKNAPRVSEAIRNFFDFIGTDQLVGHNVGFDFGFINHHSDLTGGPQIDAPAWDTVEISRVWFPYSSDHKLGTQAQNFGIDLQNAHRAQADAEASGLLLVKMSEHIIDHYPLLTNARLLDLATQAQMENSLYHFLRMIVEHQRRTALSARPPRPPDVLKPNVVENKVLEARLDIEKVFGEDGLLSTRFPNFEFRSGQLEMAELINSCFQDEKHLAVEAGTGVGKSFAYLVPSLDFANKKSTKVVVSTNTKNLQEQLFHKDLPQLKSMLPLPFKAALVKGRENYVCERRWEEFLMEQTKGLSVWDAMGLLYLFIWKMLTKSGDVSENSSFDRKRFGSVWRKVCSDRYLCAGRKCPHASKCYVMTLRKHIETSTLVVTNHSQLLADMQMENSTLGEYSYLVVDEAHNLMATAAKNLGLELSYPDVAGQLNQFCQTQRRRRSGFIHQLEQMMAKSVVGVAPKEYISLLCNDLAELTEQIRATILELYKEAQDRCDEKANYGKLRIRDTGEFPKLYKLLTSLTSDWKNLMKQITALGNVFNSLNSKQVPSYDSLAEALASFINRFSETEGALLRLANPDLDNNALWIENIRRGEGKMPTSALCYAPVDVSSQLHTMLYSTVPSIVFTSATLALRGSFRYFFGQSGLSLVSPEKLEAHIVDSPFDYDAQTRLMIASFLPEPKDRFFMNQALGSLQQILTSTDVGTMILFTSYRDLNSVYEHLGEELYRRQRPFFAQGIAASRSSMLQEFKRHKNAVLLGTSSFWEGVDIQGESLSLLILFKLPFQVPSEPVVEALIDKLEREKKDSFQHYMLPNALLRLRQGFGRLIRGKSDRGIVLIMDSRVSNKNYGTYFKQVLPAKAQELRSELELLSEVSRFFNIS